MKISELITQFESRGIEVVFQEMVEGGTSLVQWKGHIFCFVNAGDPDKAPAMAKALVEADNLASFPKNHFAADEATAAFLERIKGSPKDFIENDDVMYAAKARLLNR